MLLKKQTGFFSILLHLRCLSNIRKMTASQNNDWLAINNIRVLAADAVQKANSGHPGAPMGCAPMAHVLFSRHFKTNPSNSSWLNRDRFVLSNGHACALQYVLLHLLGYKVSLDDLKAFRQLNSNTPGHPESHDTDGIEVTTGPLGQGIANAVGLAIAQANLAQTFNKSSHQIITNHTYAICGDGCLQEGVALEAISLAGHLKLGNLVLLYDDNRIQIDGDTNLSFTENVLDRFKACGWHAAEVKDGDNDLDAIDQAIKAALEVKDQPSIIKISTTIGFGSKKAGTEKVHGSPLGDADLKVAKTALGFDPEQHFVVLDKVREFYAQIRQRGEEAEATWNAALEAYGREYPELHAELIRRKQGKLPKGWHEHLPRYTASDAAVASRKSSEILLNKIAEKLPELIGGSADLTGSNLTRWKGAVDFQHPSTGLGSYDGRYIRFGVREHAMFAICNGIAAYGAFIPFAATFLNFISYGVGAVRLAALSHLRVIYIMTHDSIGLGEDGPTHQPVETLAHLRALPNLNNWRPADGNEVSAAYWAALENDDRPSVIALSRQNLPNLEGSSVEKARQYGGYVLQDHFSNGESPQIILVSTGSEVGITVEAAKLLRSDLRVRVVSMPCTEVFDAQSLEYRRSVFPVGVPVLSIEAMSTFGWQKYAHASLGLQTFGKSGPYQKVYAHFGLEPAPIAEKARQLVAWAGAGNAIAELVDLPF